MTRLCHTYLWNRSPVLEVQRFFRIIIIFTSSMFLNSDAVLRNHCSNATVFCPNTKLDLAFIIPRRRRRDIGLSMSVRASVHLSFCPSVRSHYYVTAEWNFMKLILNMYLYHDVMHVKFGLAGLSSF